MKTKSKQIETFEQACEARSYDPIKVLPDVSTYPQKHQKAVTAYAKMVIIAEAVNKGWEPDWNDGSRKWFPWFDMEVDDNNPSGFRLFDSYCRLSASFGVAGSRLCYRTEALATYAGKTFIELYKDMMVISK